MRNNKEVILTALGRSKVYLYPIGNGVSQSKRICVPPYYFFISGLPGTPTFAGVKTPCLGCYEAFESLSEGGCTDGYDRIRYYQQQIEFDFCHINTPIMKLKNKKECMDLSVKLFRVIGCWPHWDHKHKPSEQLYFCYTAATYTVLFVYTLILIYGLIIHYKAWNSFEEAVEEIIVFATGFIVLLKITLILCNQSKLKDMIDYINNDLNKRELRDEGDESVIKSCIKHERSLTKAYIFSGYCITALYTISSIIRILRERSTNANVQTLPLKYPFHPNHFPMYHILYLHQVMVMILNGHIGTLADSFFSSLTYYLCGHFEIIKNRIAKEGGVITRNFVSYHNEMIRLVENLQSIFGTFLMFQLICNSFLLCLGLLQITQTNNIKLLHYMKCLVYVVIKLSQMFLYCWYGEQVITKSSSVAFGAYSGVWHEGRERSIASNFKMVLLRAHKPVKVRASSYFLLGLPTLAKVINSAYSFFTMFKTIQKT